MHVIEITTLILVKNFCSEVSFSLEEKRNSEGISYSITARWFPELH